MIFTLGQGSKGFSMWTYSCYFSTFKQKLESPGNFGRSIGLQLWGKGGGGEIPPYLLQINKIPDISNVMFLGHFSNPLLLATASQGTSFHQTFKGHGGYHPAWSPNSILGHPRLWYLSLVSQNQLRHGKCLFPFLFLNVYRTTSITRQPIPRPPPNQNSLCILSSLPTFLHALYPLEKWVELVFYLLQVEGRRISCFSG